MFTIYHFFIGLFLGIIFKELGYFYSTIEVIFFIIGNILIDIDHIITMFIIKEDPFMTSKNLFLKKRFKEFFNYLLKHHKEFNKLIFHNYLTFQIFFLLYLFAKNNILLYVFLLGWLTHSVIDQFDDIYAVGHLKNWFWFLNNTNRNYRFVLIISISIIVLIYLRFFNLL